MIYDISHKGEICMFSVYTVCFFGHRIIDDFRSAESAVERLISEMIDKHEFVEFLVGRDGDFDQIVTSSVIRYKKKTRRILCAHLGNAIHESGIYP